MKIPYFAAAIFLPLLLGPNLAEALSEMQPLPTATSTHCEPGVPVGTEQHLGDECRKCYVWRGRSLAAMHILGGIGYCSNVKRAPLFPGMGPRKKGVDGPELEDGDPADQDSKGETEN